MYTVSIEKAQHDLPDLIRAVARGEEIVIEHDGVPAARLVAAFKAFPGEAPGQRFARGFGALRGTYEFSSWENWKEADAEIEAAFEQAIEKPFP